MDYELRCCCHPQNLLGWVPAPAGLRQGERVRFILRAPRGLTGRALAQHNAAAACEQFQAHHLELTVATYCERHERLWPDDPHPSTPLIESWQHAYPAFSAHHQAVEVFLRIPGFRPCR